MRVEQSSGEATENYQYVASSISANAEIRKRGTKVQMCGPAQGETQLPLFSAKQKG